jgi:hypothetical protein
VTFGDVSDILIFVTREFSRMVPSGTCPAIASNNTFRSKQRISCGLLEPWICLWTFLSLNLVKYEIFIIRTWDPSSCLWIITLQMGKSCVYQDTNIIFWFQGKTYFVIYVLTTFLYILILMWFFCGKEFTLLHNEKDPRLPNVSRIDWDIQLCQNSWRNL